MTPENVPGETFSGGGGGGQGPDPVVVDFPIAYVERPLPTDENNNFTPHDLLDPDAFNPGARLFLKLRASVPAAEVDISTRAFSVPVNEEEEEEAELVQPLYDVKDISASDDGEILLFSMRAPEDPNAETQPTWNIWQYHLETDELKRVIFSDLIAEEGHDISPAFLPDGRIVFSSSRQRRSKAILLDESKPQFSALAERGRDNDEAFVLHTMDEDGTNIEQITYNPSHDLYPTVLDSGEIAFLRWDNFVGIQGQLSLYKINPNGSNLTLLYGYHSQNTASNDAVGAFVKPREMPDGRILVTLRPRVAEKHGGDFVAIDTTTFTDINQPIASNDGASGPAQVSMSVAPIISDGSVSYRGYFGSAYPLNDGTDRFLVGWSTCRVLGFRLGIFVDASGIDDLEDPNQEFPLINDTGDYVDRTGLISFDPFTVKRRDLNDYPCTEATISLSQIPESETAYGLWIYDTAIATQAPVVLAKDGYLYEDAIVLEPRTPATHIPAPVAGVADPAVAGSEALVDNNLGVLHIRNVYDMDGVDTAPGGYAALADPAQTTAAERPARFLRLSKVVSQPNNAIYNLDEDIAFGVGHNMQDILGYVPIEPDGSAMFLVPADVAFTVAILNASGKRAFEEHRNWLTVRPGEIRHCNGCHTDESEAPHGRLDAEPPSSNLGALANVHFPNTVLLDNDGAPLARPELNETMAQYRARVSGPRVPSMNILFTDDWTNQSVRPADPAIEYNYADLASDAVPMKTLACLENWNALCRVVINYPEHIQTLWDAPRPACTTCHNTLEAAANPQIVDLSATLNEEGLMISYVELFEDPVNADSIMVPGNALGSQRFFQLFEQGGGTVDHRTFLNGAELKLIAEWLDIGGQYYNNPFDAPLQ